MSDASEKVCHRCKSAIAVDEPSYWRTPREQGPVFEHENADACIRALRTKLTHLACPRCGTVNPPEVHTCTPRPRVTVLDEWRVYSGSDIEHDGLPTRDAADAMARDMDRLYPSYAPHTVRRVALIDEPTTQGE